MIHLLLTALSFALHTILSTKFLIGVVAGAAIGMATLRRLAALAAAKAEAAAKQVHI